MDTILIRVNSHRARQKMAKLIGEQQCYYSFDRYCTGGFYRLLKEDAAKALVITGISKARDGDDIHPCIKW